MFLGPRGTGSLRHQGPMLGAFPARPSGVIWQYTPDPEEEREKLLQGNGDTELTSVHQREKA